VPVVQRKVRWAGEGGGLAEHGVMPMPSPETQTATQTMHRQALASHGQALTTGRAPTTPTHEKHPSPHAA